MEKYRATQYIEVWIARRSWNIPLENTQIGLIPEERRSPMSIHSSGTTYTIEPGELFTFNRSNQWDASFFNLENGAEFKIDAGDYKKWLSDIAVKV